MRAAFSALILGTAFLFAVATAAFSNNFDFRAFYCAGTAVRMHANPYRTEPLRTCEQTQTDAAFATFFKSTALPAPQPAYDIALFEPLAWLPFAIASKVWTAILACCAFLSILLLRRLCRADIAVTCAAVWLSLCVTSLYLGEIVPICICAIAAAALFAQRRNYALAGIAAAVTLVEPHIGVPICASVAVWMPRARITLAACVAGLAALSIAVVGLAANVEYLVAVLPAHALSEISSDAQLGISAILHALGVANGLALRLGTLSWVLLSLYGIVLARSLSRRFNDGAFIVTLPAAFAVTGGVFMHVTEIVAAIPLALLLIGHVRAHRTAIAASLVLLAVPWWSLATPMLFGSAIGVVLAVVTIYYLVLHYSGSASIGAAACILGAAALTALLRWHDATAIHASLAVLPPSAAHAAYPEAGWKWFNDVYMSTGSPAAWLLRGGTWTGLALLGYSCFQATGVRASTGTACAFIIGGLACAVVAGAVLAHASGPCHDVAAGPIVFARTSGGTQMPIPIIQQCTRAAPLWSWYYVGYLLCGLGMLLLRKARASWATTWLTAVVAIALAAATPFVPNTDPYTYALYAYEAAVMHATPYAVHQLGLTVPVQASLGYLLPEHGNVLRSLWYGPAFAALYAAAVGPFGVLSLGSMIYAERCLDAVLLVALGWLLSRIPKAEADQQRSFIFVVLNPLLLFESVAFAHADVAMLVLISAAYLAYRQKRFVFAVLLCVLAVEVRVVAAVALMVLFWDVLQQRRMRDLLTTVAGGAMSFAISYILARLAFGRFLLSGPFFYSGVDAPVTVVATALFGNTPRALIIGMLAQASAGVALLYGAFRERVYSLVPVAVLAALPVLEPWYVQWLVPVAAVTSNKPYRYAVLVASALLPVKTLTDMVVLPQSAAVRATIAIALWTLPLAFYTCHVRVMHPPVQEAYDA